MNVVKCDVIRKRNLKLRQGKLAKKNDEWDDKKSPAKKAAPDAAADHDRQQR